MPVGNAGTSQPLVGYREFSREWPREKSAIRRASRPRAPHRFSTTAWLKSRDCATAIASATLKLESRLRGDSLLRRRGGHRDGRGYLDAHSGSRKMRASSSSPRARRASRADDGASKNAARGPLPPFRGRDRLPVTARAETPRRLARAHLRHRHGERGKRATCPSNT